MRAEGREVGRGDAAGFQERRIPLALELVPTDRVGLVTAVLLSQGDAGMRAGSV